MGKKFLKKFFTNFHGNNINGHRKTDSTTSESSIDLFRTINDRKFINQENAKEILPVDDDESDRINLVHFFKKELWPRSKATFSSPVKEKFISGA